MLDPIRLYGFDLNPCFGQTGEKRYYVYFVDLKGRRVSVATYHAKGRAEASAKRLNAKGGGN